MLPDLVSMKPSVTIGLFDIVLSSSPPDTGLSSIMNPAAPRGDVSVSFPRPNIPLRPPLRAAPLAEPGPMFSCMVCNLLQYEAGSVPPSLSNFSIASWTSLSPLCCLPHIISCFCIVSGMSDGAPLFLPPVEDESPCPRFMSILEYFPF